jgi:antagonist of KipI
MIDPGFAVTVQDLGRRGFQRYGVPACGAMDAFALMAVNHLVGNALDAAGLETALAGFSMKANIDCLVAAGGRGFKLFIEGKECPLWSAVFVKNRATILLQVSDQSGWGYLAVSGGIRVAPVLSSSSTYLPAGWGGFKGRRLQEGDELQICEHPALTEQTRLEGRTLTQGLVPEYLDSITVRMIPAPPNSCIAPNAQTAFLQNDYQIDQTSRMAYLLKGDQLPIPGKPDILSEGVGAGVIQVTGAGQPMVLMSDAQTTGGYAKLGTVVRADINLLAQCTAETGRVRFSVTTVTNAQTLWRKKINDLMAIE